LSETKIRGKPGLKSRISLTLNPGYDRYDEEGRIVGIEILDASKRTEDPTALKQFSFEEG
jgi:Protein of unknown function (DUF2283)